MSVPPPLSLQAPPVRTSSALHVTVAWYGEVVLLVLIILQVKLPPAPQVHAPLAITKVSPLPHFCKSATACPGFGIVGFNVAITIPEIINSEKTAINVYKVLLLKLIVIPLFMFYSVRRYLNSFLLN